MNDTLSNIDVVRLDPETDLALLRPCFIEMQEYERGIDARIPQGETVADAYLADVQHACRTKDGTILVARHAARDGETVVGYAVLLCDESTGDLTDGNLGYAFLHSLAVLEAYRGRGIGRLLMREAEAIARRSGKATLRLLVYAENSPARGLYAAEGFHDQEVVMEKPLD